MCTQDVDGCFPFESTLSVSLELFQTNKKGKNTFSDAYMTHLKQSRKPTIADRRRFVTVFWNRQTPFTTSVRTLHCCSVWEIAKLLCCPEGRNWWIRHLKITNGFMMTPCKLTWIWFDDALGRQHDMDTTSVYRANVASRECHQKNMRQTDMDPLAVNLLVLGCDCLALAGSPPSWAT